MVSQPQEQEQAPSTPDPESQPVPDGMALIKVGMDAAVLHLNVEAMRILNYAKQQKIENEDDAKHVANDLITLSGIRKEVRDKQAEYLRPIRSFVDQIMDRFKMISGPIDEAEAIFRTLIGGWQKACAEKVRHQKELEDLKNQVTAKEAEVAGKPAPVIPPSDLMLQPDQHKIRATAGTIGTMGVKKWKLVDFAKVPDRYKAIDTAAINKLVKGGGSCDGIEVYVEQVPRIVPNR